MSKLSVYAIRDTKAEAFHRPFYSHNHATAMRSVETEVNNPETGLKNPEDFQLYHLGEYEEQTGILKTHAPEHLINVMELRKEEQ